MPVGMPVRARVICQDLQFELIPFPLGYQAGAVGQSIYVHLRPSLILYAVLGVFSVKEQRITLFYTKNVQYSI